MTSLRQWEVGFGTLSREIGFHLENKCFIPRNGREDEYMGIMWVKKYQMSSVF